MALTLDLLGRKTNMLIVAVPLVLCWLAIAFAKSVFIFCLLRFLTGFCGGTFCVVAPAYIGEIADKDIRGTLSVFFQLLLVIGIFSIFVLGEFKSIMLLSVPLTVGPIGLFLIVFFYPNLRFICIDVVKLIKLKKYCSFFEAKIMI